MRYFNAERVQETDTVIAWGKIEIILRKSEKL